VKDQFQGLRHSQIGILFDLAAGGPAKAHGKRKLPLSAAGLLSSGLQGPLLQEVQRELRHRPFQTQQQPVVDELRVIHAVDIYPHGIHPPAQLDQLVPVAAVARQTRRRETEDGAHFATQHFGDQALKAWALHQAGARASQIFIDHHDILKAQPTRLIHQAILAARALLGVQDLVG
jgi:hypothetical protein